MKQTRLPLLTGFFVLCIGLMPVALHGAEDADALPANLGHSLRRLVAWSQAQPRDLPAAESRARLEARFPEGTRHFQTDAGVTRAIVDVRLDGTAAPAAVSAALTALGVEVFAQPPAASSGAGGVLSARLPLDAAAVSARLPGVASISLVRRPHCRIGKATSQGVSVLKANALSAAGYDGAGITVGVISDSFDAAAADPLGNALADHAAQDIASGDLPGPGNPFNHTTPVYVLADADAADTANTDEGRAMLQIVHDLAPGAALAFCTHGSTPEALAANIRALRTNPDAHCDVIVDDMAFDEEPFFSDGPAAMAVDEVVHDNNLPGRRVLYYSAAGNFGAVGSYDAVFNPVSDEKARNPKTATDNLKLDQVPAALTAGGFHNFTSRAGSVTLAQRVTVQGDRAMLNFQWDDPWVPRLISTDYNLLVFDAAGNYLPDLSGTEDSIKMGHAIEIVDLPLGPKKSAAVYQLAIARSAAGLQQATHLRYLVSTDGSFRAKNFTPYNVPTVYGHTAANGADAVAAYSYAALAEPEDYSSAGPVTVYFDASGNRLATPEVRQQPTVAAVDGVNTTFFPAGPGNDSDGDGLPNFYGTSAAAPHVAGVAALLLQAAGGPGSLSDVQMRGLLENTARAHDLDPAASSAAIADASGKYTAALTANGDSSDYSAFAKSFFELSFQGPGTSELHTVVIDLSGAGEEFDPTPGTGFPFTIRKSASSVAAVGVTATFGGKDKSHPAKLKLTFAPGAFKPGGTLTFGIDRDLALSHASGNSADLLAGAGVKAHALDQGAAVKAAGVFVNRMGTGYSPVVGYGLIDAAAAFQMLGNAGLVTLQNAISPPPGAVSQER